KVKAEKGSVLDYPQGEKLPVAACLEVDCDVLIPAARPDSINMSNYNKVKAKLIVQGANVPVQFEAERKLHDKGILNLPCFIANAGGVICGALEYAGATESQVFPTIEEKITRNTRNVLERTFSKKMYPRDAAIALAKERVLEAMKYRKIHI
ncbi:MAG: Glu/Leu/Phe/Val dehydrogenase, partial [Planctomycetota bacterium]|nr:Glu/Leu/Phe/Val dehydrogenase [Planctomycetota bacterium]